MSEGQVLLFILSFCLIGACFAVALVNAAERHKCIAKGYSEGAYAENAFWMWVCSILSLIGGACWGYAFYYINFL